MFIFILFYSVLFALFFFSLLLVRIFFYFTLSTYFWPWTSICGFEIGVGHLILFVWLTKCASFDVWFAV